MKRLGFGMLFLFLAACSSDNTVASGSSAIGGACTANKDCKSGLTCSVDDPGGLCFKTCATSADCGAGASCSPDELKCYQTCKTNADCTRPGYGCIGYSATEQWCDALPTVDAGTPDAH